MEGSTNTIRLSKAAREFNVGMNTIIEFLTKKGYKLEAKPNTKLEPKMYELLVNEFQAEKKVKEIAHQKGLEFVGKETITLEDTIEEKEVETEKEDFENSDELFIKSTTVGPVPKQQAKQEPPAKEVEKKEEKAPDIQEEIKEEKPEEETVQAESKTSEPEPEPESEQVPAPETEAPAVEAKEETKEEEKPEVQAQEKTEMVEKEVEPEAAPPQKEEEKAAPVKAEEPAKEDEESDTRQGVKILGSIDLDKLNQKTRPAKKSKQQKAAEKAAEKAKKQKSKETPAQPKAEKVAPTKGTEIETAAKKAEPEKPAKKEEKKESNFIPTTFQKLTGPTIVDKIELPEKEAKKKKKPVASSSSAVKGKKKRRRITTEKAGTGERGAKASHKEGGKGRDKGKKFRKQVIKHEPTEEEIQKQIKETLARLSAPTGKSASSKYRKQKREHLSQVQEEEMKQQEQEKSTLKVTEFLTANELANMMNVNVNDIIKTCMQLGLFVSINQRLDAETIAILAEEYGFKVSFVDVEEHDLVEEAEEEDDPALLKERAPIVTVMGHVDHGKTKLLDYIRKENVVAGEAGGITQHIGAYEVTLDNEKKITFLDTPGHEAFTAMRARGAKVTDVAIIVIAADDSVMPQTKEAINHAQAAGVPIVFALNKIDKPTANVDKIKEQLANMNILVEDWGGKYQSQEISAITGKGIPELLEKVLLESELLELKANKDKPGKGTVIESSLDKGRGYVATILVQDGTIAKGDILIAGPVFGRVKALFNERAKEVKKAGPSTPVLLLGLTGAPQAGDILSVMKDEKEAKAIATKRTQLMREQSLRSQKHITLDEIGRRIAIGDFKELNVIVKGDVDGSVEALSDALLKLSTEEVQVNIIHKGVGAITESDILLASASDAIIIGFQVRPVPQARKLAENEQIDIRLYSIIYQATEELESAIEGMLAPKMEEKITCNLEIRETFKITKVGTIAGCYVMDGKINRNTKIRLIRNGIVIYTGNLGSLKRFKDDVKEVSAGYECGLNIENFNDIKVGDYIEGFEQVEVARKK